MECDLQEDYCDQYRREHAEAGKKAHKGRQGSMQRQINGHTVADKGGHCRLYITTHEFKGSYGYLSVVGFLRISRHFEVAMNVVAVHCCLTCGK